MSVLLGRDNLTIGVALVCLPIGLVAGHHVAHLVQQSTETHGGRPTPSHHQTQMIAAILFCLVGLQTGATWPLLPILILVAVLLGVSIIDWSHQRIPNLAIKPAFVGSSVLLLLISLLAGTGSIMLGVLGAAAFSGLLGTIHRLSPDGMGRGDVRLAALLGLFIGWTSQDVYDTGWNIGLVLLLASILGLFSALLVEPRMKQNCVARSFRGRQVPFGPALSVATTLVVLSSV